jgi:hypothetical protein
MLERELRGIFGTRLQSLVVYGLRSRTVAAAAASTHTSSHNAHANDPSLVETLAVVDSLSADDLRACAARIASWHDAGLGTPLLLALREFGRSLDAFPFEFGAILSDHEVVAGSDPFEGLTVDVSDLRRSCEVQARGHLLHLREGYLETRGRGDALAVLLVRSAPAFAALVMSVARLDGMTTVDLGAAARHVEQIIGSAAATASQIVELIGVNEISSAEAERLFPPYLDAMERLVKYVDAWLRS